MSSKEAKTTVLSKKDLNGVLAGWMFWRQTAWNYETMQGNNVAVILAPVLRKIYRDDEQFKQALVTHSAFYNTALQLGALIIGAVVAVEEQHALAEDGDPDMAFDKTAQSIKASLMGPVAGIGDSLTALILAVSGAIAASMGDAGSPVGLLIAVGISMGYSVGLTKWLFDMGYTQGAKVISTLSSKIQSIVVAASVLGVTVIGGMIATNVTISSSLEYAAGETAISLQGLCDSIMPCLLPALTVFVSYKLLGKFGTTQVILMVLAFALVFGGLGIFS